MSLTKVLSLIGDDNIEYQNVENSALKMKINKKHGDCEVTFATCHDLLNGCGKTGLIVWLGNDELKMAVNKVEGLKQKTNHDLFQYELSQLLNKYGYAIICESQKNENDTTVQIGFQDSKMINTWVGRHHVTGYDLE